MIRSLFFSLILGVIICYPGESHPGPDDEDYSDEQNDNDQGTIVEMFEWKWLDIADECERYLGPAGFGAVQVSSPAENLILRTKDGKRSWHERNLIMSYKLETRLGNEEDFAAMTKKCTNVGVKIYASVIINHMTGDHDHNVGTGNSTADFKTFCYPGVPYEKEHFHCPTCNLINYEDKDQVYNCQLDGLKDLNQTHPHVKKMIVGYLNHLISLGVAGFRIQYAKFIDPKDLKNIVECLDNLNTECGFPENKKPYVYLEVLPSGAVQGIDYFPLGLLVTEYKVSEELYKIFRGNKSLNCLSTWADDSWDLLPSDNAIVFVDNHDLQRCSDPKSLTFKEELLYKVATTFLLAQPYGRPIVMSSYSFTTFDQGPPSDEHECITSPVIKEDGLGCVGAEWVCEHRWSPIRQLVKFRNIIGNAKVKNWWDNGKNQIAFSRGTKGFIVFNLEGIPLKQTLQTGLPAGEYCDIISGKRDGDKCTGQKINVCKNGEAEVCLSGNAQANELVIAIHVGKESCLSAE